jgi:hypothetical protein
VIDHVAQAKLVLRFVPKKKTGKSLKIEASRHVDVWWWFHIGASFCWRYGSSFQNARKPKDCMDASIIFNHSWTVDKVASHAGSEQEPSLPNRLKVTDTYWHHLTTLEDLSYSRSIQIYPASWSSDLSPWLQNCPSRCFWSEKVSQVLAVAHWRHRGIVKTVTAAIDELIRCRHRAYVAALATNFSCQMLSCTIRKVPWVLCRHGDGVDGIVMFGNMK